MNRLVAIGFQCIGHWKLGNGRPVCELKSQMNTKNILYAFISNGEVQSIGKSTQPLKGRMYTYQKIQVRTNRQTLRTTRTTDAF